MARPREKELPPPPRPKVPSQPQRLYSSSSSPPSSPIPSAHSSPSSGDSLSSQIQRLEDENEYLRRKVDALQNALTTSQRKHAADLATKTTLLRKQNHQCNRLIDRQNQLVTNLVNTVYTVFADYKEEVSLLNKTSEEEGGSDEIRVYSTLDGQTWI